MSSTSPLTLVLEHQEVSVQLDLRQLAGLSRSSDGEAVDLNFKSKILYIELLKNLWLITCPTRLQYLHCPPGKPGPHTQLNYIHSGMKFSLKYTHTGMNRQTSSNNNKKFNIRAANSSSSWTHTCPFSSADSVTLILAILR